MTLLSCLQWAEWSARVGRWWTVEGLARSRAKQSPAKTAKTRLHPDHPSSHLSLIRETFRG